MVVSLAENPDLHFFVADEQIPSDDIEDGVMLIQHKGIWVMIRPGLV